MLGCVEQHNRQMSGGRLFCIYSFLFIEEHIFVFALQVRQYPMGNYESNLDEEGKLFPPPNHHRVNMDSYLNSYLYNPAFYLLSVARVSAMVEAYCGPEEPQEVKLGRSCGGQREATEKEATSNRRDGQTNTQKVKTEIYTTLAFIGKHYCVDKKGSQDVEDTVIFNPQ